MIDIGVFLRNMDLLSDYKLGEVNIYSEYYKISSKDVDKILGVNDSLVVLSSFSRVGVDYKRKFNYNYIYGMISRVGNNDYVTIFIYKIDDDYYKVRISVYNNYVNNYGYNYYKLDQIGGLLKFLKILFRYE